MCGTNNIGSLFICSTILFVASQHVMDRKLSIRLADIYYSPKGYWRGLEAIKKLASAAKTSEDVARAWLKK
ncbi:MAG: hypothetical protein AB2556_25895, partial [Candidatus Thiodiazotropha sp.]